MTNIAFIPVRGGSKSIPLKNIKLICGKPLVYWTAKAACECSHIDDVYIATDSDEIKKAVEVFCSEEPNIFSKLHVVDRSAENASDTASTESAMLEFVHGREFDNIVLIQATSPLLTADDLNGGFELFNMDGTDSVLSVVRQKRFLWNNDENGIASPSNYDVYNRPRRQDYEGYLMENGAFYIISRDDLIKSKNRLSGNIRAYEMPEDTAVEIDEPEDFIMIESLMKRRNSSSGDKQNEIKMVLTDCDGCLTDGGMYYSEKGDELKKFNTKDGMAFKLLREHGILTGIITGENVDLNRRRAEKLKLDIYEPGCTDKATCIKKICAEKNIDLSNVLYVGDDINDIEVLKIVGYGCAPADALDEVRSVASYVTKARGGEGVIREITDRIVLAGK